MSTQDPALTRRTTLGDFELTWCTDGTYVLDGGAMFGVVPKPLWSKRITPDAQNRITLGLNTIIVRTGRHNVLIETGIGNKLGDKQKSFFEPQEKLLDSLAAARIAPDEIDVVINTHLHFDHCGWNTVRQAGKVVPAFPRAKYYVQEGEWRHGSLQLERDRVSYISDNYDPLIQSGQMTLLNGDADIVPGISVRVFPGHTAHMQAVMIESAGKKACYISDLIPTAAHLDVTWVMAYDLFPLQSIESRKRLYAEAIPEKWLMLFTHDPKTPWAYVEKSETGKLSAIVSAAD